VTEKEKLGKQVIKLREKISSRDYKKEHISQQELADNNIGLTKYLIGTIERGEANPTLEKLVYLAKSLNLDTLKILDIEINVKKFINEISNEE